MKNHDETRAHRDLMFVDLSTDLDHGLSFVVSLLENCDNEARINLSGLAHYLIQYLGNRAALESAFFKRTLGIQMMDESKLRAELSRIKKLLKVGSIHERA